MKEKLRRIELERHTFEWSKEELELWEDIKCIMEEDELAKGSGAEEIAKQYLDEKYGSEHVEDMRYPEDLTKFNSLIMDALEGRGFHSYNGEWWRYRKKHPERIDLLDIWSILKNLEDMAKAKNDTKALDLIGELQERFKDDIIDAYKFKELLGLLKGTKFDFIAVNDGRDEEKSKGSILFDAKYWDDGYRTPSINQRELEFYIGFANKGIPFYLLYLNKGREKLYECDIRKVRDNLSSFPMRNKGSSIFRIFPSENLYLKEVYFRDDDGFWKLKPSSI